MSIEEWTAYAAFATLGIAAIAAIISGIALWQSRKTGEIIEEQKDIVKFSYMSMMTKEIVDALDIKDPDERFIASTEIFMMVGYMFEKMEEGGPLDIREKNGVPYAHIDYDDYRKWLKEQIKKETGEEPKDN